MFTSTTPSPSPPPLRSAIAATATPSAMTSAAVPPTSLLVLPRHYLADVLLHNDFSSQLNLNDSATMRYLRSQLPLLVQISMGRIDLVDYASGLGRQSSHAATSSPQARSSTTAMSTQRNHRGLGHPNDARVARHDDDNDDDNDPDLRLSEDENVDAGEEEPPTSPCFRFSHRGRNRSAVLSCHSSNSSGSSGSSSDERVRYHGEPPSSSSPSSSSDAAFAPRPLTALQRDRLITRAIEALCGKTALQRETITEPLIPTCGRVWNRACAHRFFTRHRAIVEEVCATMLSACDALERVAPELSKRVRALDGHNVGTAVGTQDASSSASAATSLGPPMVSAAIPITTAVAPAEAAGGAVVGTAKTSAQTSGCFNALTSSGMSDVTTTTTTTTTDHFAPSAVRPTTANTAVTVTPVSPPALRVEREVDSAVALSASPVSSAEAAVLSGSCPADDATSPLGRTKTVAESGEAVTGGGRGGEREPSYPSFSSVSSSLSKQAQGRGDTHTASSLPLPLEALQSSTERRFASLQNGLVLLEAFLVALVMGCDPITMDTLNISEEEEEEDNEEEESTAVSLCRSRTMPPAWPPGYSDDMLPSASLGTGGCSQISPHSPPVFSSSSSARHGVLAASESLAVKQFLTSPETSLVGGTAGDGGGGLRSQRPQQPSAAHTSATVVPADTTVTSDTTSSFHQPPAPPSPTTGETSTKEDPVSLVVPVVMKTFTMTLMTVLKLQVQIKRYQRRESISDDNDDDDGNDEEGGGGGGSKGRNAVPVPSPRSLAVTPASPLGGGGGGTAVAGAERGASASYSIATSSIEPERENPQLRQLDGFVEDVLAPATQFTLGVLRLSALALAAHDLSIAEAAIKYVESAGPIFGGHSTILLAHILTPEVLAAHPRTSRGGQALQWAVRFVFGGCDASDIDRMQQERRRGMRRVESTVYSIDGSSSTNSTPASRSPTGLGGQVIETSGAPSEAVSGAGGAAVQVNATAAPNTNVEEVASGEKGPPPATPPTTGTTTTSPKPTSPRLVSLRVECLLAACFTHCHPLLTAIGCIAENDDYGCADTVSTAVLQYAFPLSLIAAKLLRTPSLTTPWSTPYAETLLHELHELAGVDESKLVLLKNEWVPRNSPFTGSPLGGRSVMGAITPTTDTSAGGNALTTTGQSVTNDSMSSDHSTPPLIPLIDTNSSALGTSAADALESPYNRTSRRTFAIHWAKVVVLSGRTLVKSGVKSIPLPRDQYERLRRLSMQLQTMLDNYADQKRSTMHESPAEMLNTLGEELRSALPLSTSASDSDADGEEEEEEGGDGDDNVPGAGDGSSLEVEATAPFLFPSVSAKGRNGGTRSRRSSAHEQTVDVPLREIVFASLFVIFDAMGEILHCPNPRLNTITTNEMMTLVYEVRLAMLESKASVQLLTPAASRFRFTDATQPPDREALASAPFNLLSPPEYCILIENCLHAREAAERWRQQSQGVESWPAAGFGPLLNHLVRRIDEYLPPSQEEFLLSRATLRLLLGVTARDEAGNMHGDVLFVDNLDVEGSKKKDEQVPRLGVTASNVMTTQSTPQTTPPPPPQLSNNNSNSGGVDDTSAPLGRASTMPSVSSDKARAVSSPEEDQKVRTQVTAAAAATSLVPLKERDASSANGGGGRGVALPSSSSSFAVAPSTVKPTPTTPQEPLELGLNAVSTTDWQLRHVVVHSRATTYTNSSGSNTASSSNPSTTTTSTHSSHSSGSSATQPHAENSITALATPEGGTSGVSIDSGADHSTSGDSSGTTSSNCSNSSQGGVNHRPPIVIATPPPPSRASEQASAKVVPGMQLTSHEESAAMCDRTAATVAEFTARDEEGEGGQLPDSSATPHTPSWSAEHVDDGGGSGDTTCDDEAASRGATVEDEEGGPLQLSPRSARTPELTSPTSFHARGGMLYDSSDEVDIDNDGDDDEEEDKDVEASLNSGLVRAVTAAKRKSPLPSPTHIAVPRPSPHGDGHGTASPTRITVPRPLSPTNGSGFVPVDSRAALHGLLPTSAGIGLPAGLSSSLSLLSALTRHVNGGASTTNSNQSSGGGGGGTGYSVPASVTMRPVSPLVSPPRSHSSSPALRRTPSGALHSPRSASSTRVVLVGTMGDLREIMSRTPPHWHCGAPTSVSPGGDIPTTTSTMGNTNTAAGTSSDRTSRGAEANLLSSSSSSSSNVLGGVTIPIGMTGLVSGGGLRRSPADNASAEALLKGPPPPAPNYMVPVTTTSTMAGGASMTAASGSVLQSPPSGFPLFGGGGGGGGVGEVASEAVMVDQDAPPGIANRYPPLAGGGRGFGDGVAVITGGAHTVGGSNGGRVSVPTTVSASTTSPFVSLRSTPPSSSSPSVLGTGSGSSLLRRVVSPGGGSTVSEEEIGGGVHGKNRTSSALRATTHVVCVTPTLSPSTSLTSASGTGGATTPVELGGGSPAVADMSTAAGSTGTFNGSTSLGAGGSTTLPPSVAPLSRSPLGAMSTTSVSATVPGATHLVVPMGATGGVYLDDEDSNPLTPNLSFTAGASPTRLSPLSTHNSVNPFPGDLHAAMAALNSAGGGGGAAVTTTTVASSPSFPSSSSPVSSSSSVGQPPLITLVPGASNTITPGGGMHGCLFEVPTYAPSSTTVPLAPYDVMGSYGSSANTTAVDTVRDSAPLPPPPLPPPPPPPPSEQPWPTRRQSSGFSTSVPPSSASLTTVTGATMTPAHSTSEPTAMPTASHDAPQLPRTMALSSVSPYSKEDDRQSSPLITPATLNSLTSATTATTTAANAVNPNGSASSIGLSSGFTRFSASLGHGLQASSSPPSSSSTPAAGPTAATTTTTSPTATTMFAHHTRPTTTGSAATAAAAAARHAESQSPPLPVTAGGYSGSSSSSSGSGHPMGKPHRSSAATASAPSPSPTSSPSNSNGGSSPSPPPVSGAESTAFSQQRIDGSSSSGGGDHHPASTSLSELQAPASTSPAPANMQRNRAGGLGQLLYADATRSPTSPCSSDADWYRQDAYHDCQSSHSENNSGSSSKAQANVMGGEEPGQSTQRGLAAATGGFPPPPPLPPLAPQPSSVASAATAIDGAPASGSGERRIRRARFSSDSSSSNSDEEAHSGRGRGGVKRDVKDDGCPLEENHATTATATTAAVPGRCARRTSSSPRLSDFLFSAVVALPEALTIQAATTSTATPSTSSLGRPSVSSAATDATSSGGGGGEEVQRRALRESTNDAVHPVEGEEEEESGGIVTTTANRAQREGGGEEREHNGKEEEDDAEDSAPLPRRLSSPGPPFFFRRFGFPLSEEPDCFTATEPLRGPGFSPRPTTAPAAAAPPPPSPTSSAPNNNDSSGHHDEPERGEAGHDGGNDGGSAAGATSFLAMRSSTPAVGSSGDTPLSLSGLPSSSSAAALIAFAGHPALHHASPRKQQLLSSLLSGIGSTKAAPAHHTAGGATVGKLISPVTASRVRHWPSARGSTPATPRTPTTLLSVPDSSTMMVTATGAAAGAGSSGVQSLTTSPSPTRVGAPAVAVMTSTAQVLVANSGTAGGGSVTLMDAGDGATSQASAQHLGVDPSMHLARAAKAGLGASSTSSPNAVGMGSTSTMLGTMNVGSPLSSLPLSLTSSAGSSLTSGLMVSSLVQPPNTPLPLPLPSLAQTPTTPVTTVRPSVPFVTGRDAMAQLTKRADRLDGERKASPPSGVETAAEAAETTAQTASIREGSMEGET